MNITLKELKNVIKQVIKESNNQQFVSYKKKTDEDRTVITAYINNEKAGELWMETLFESYTYEFDDVFDEDTFDQIFPGEIIVKIEHLKVDDKYKSSGIGTELVKRSMELMKKKGYNQFYLNASPMGFTGLNTNELVNFYKKFGFKELLNQGHNVLMGIVFN